ncbi:helix-turn-helix transcriptional regulator [Citrobacter koseri]|uniref:AraC family transcriptional regulator n=1 Tax=Citrobacter koseri TaxID=545 RepID=UPI000E120EA5|nr:helix-turn-helix transcriptional regulator [Citrobacter koseri]MBJ9305029.1 helix-turn-helix transcriptional regulator [Citrobacter koseri]MBJ9369117.1 helix-turn-helix transcriptional regulator [Citrobacter koseri]SUX92240.1 arabinose operon regulatory protein [Citrobacter koseri]HAT2780892.1 helix-turn-helix domain-containing protein [Citrobacter koseri]
MMIESIQPLHHSSKHTTQWHHHPGGQLYWITRGMVMVETEQGQWALTPGSVGWIPPSLPHCAWMPVSAYGASLHFSAEFCGVFPSSPCVRAASPFLLLLLEKICGEGTIGESSERLAHLLQVMVDEIRYADALSSQLVLPDDRRVRQIAQKILADRACTRSQAELAKQAGLSVRTLSRLFIQQTGLTFGQWKQKAKVILSLEYLLRGEPVSLVAQLAGYENVSAFIAVFRRFMGMTPGQFYLRFGHGTNVV